MLNMLRLVPAFSLLLLVTGIPTKSQGAEPSREAVAAAMNAAATYFRTKVARHGGYVYFYSIDLQQRFGEGVASQDQIWVQPPGTPTVGSAYLAAYAATRDRFYLDAATETAEALIYGQLESGGWANCIDFDPRGSRVARYRNGKGRGRNRSSLDDDQSQSVIRFLMRVDQAHDFKHRNLQESVEFALNALLKAQFTSGAFPQGWDQPVDQQQPAVKASLPNYDWRTEGRIKNYWDMYTLNDGLAGSVAQVLIDAHQIYGDDRYKLALARLGDFLLLAQLPDPQPAWAQQYNYQMHPIWARKFEPAAVASRESQDVLAALMTIYEHTSDEKYLAPLPSAITYLRGSLLPDGKLARFYELRTNRPLYMRRNGSEYELTYDDKNLPDHYGWKVSSQLDKLEARYQQLKRGVIPAARRPSTAKLARRVQAIIESLDAEGRWLSTSSGDRLIGDHRLPAGTEYLSSETFSENLELLSEFLGPTEPAQR